MRTTRFPRPVVEVLEPRMLLSVSAELSVGAGPPVLATDMGGGVLLLNMGPSAGLREAGAVDGNESFEVAAGPNPGDVIVKAFGYSEVHSGVTHIYAEGGSGNDTIALDPGVSATAELWGDFKDPAKAADFGNDMISAGDGTSGVGVTLIVGGGGDDILTLGNSAGTVYGGAGNDYLFGSPGNDTLYGGSGSDVIFGQGGVDTIDQDGLDGPPLPPPPTPTPILATDLGGGVLRLNMGPNAGERGAGATDDDETFEVAPGANPGEVVVTAFGISEVHTGVSRIYAEGGSGDDTIIIDAGVTATAELWGDFKDPARAAEFGDDIIMAGDGAAEIHGGGGDDVLMLGSAAGTVFGDDGNDQIFGSAGNDLLYGGNGDDLMYGGAGNDTMHGGMGNDTVYGEDGNDNMFGDLGDDLLDGGAGNDTMLGDSGTIVDKIPNGPPTSLFRGQDLKLIALFNLFARSQPVVTLTDAAHGGNDVMYGGAGNDRMHGGAGDDAMYGGDGNDALFGNLGNDALVGDAGSDHLYGGAGNDALDGGQGADLLFGGDGQDTLVADQAGDVLVDACGSSFITAGKGRLAPLIIRSPCPLIQDFVLRLAAGDGASDPYGELAITGPMGFNPCRGWWA
jgi:Ca2+-binding RTX toxin-like protein